MTHDRILPLKVFVPLLAALLIQARMPAWALGSAPEAMASEPARAPSGRAVAIQGGTASLDVALGTLVPESYVVEVDESIPPETLLTWNAGADWWLALADAARTAGLRVIGQWERNAIVLARVSGPALAKPAPANANVAMPISLAATASSARAESRWSVDVRDVHLANTFHRWAKTAGWRVRWDAEKHVMVEAPDTFVGSFEDAVAAQLASPGIAHGAYPLEVCFYPNSPPLARVTRKGDQFKECQ